MLGRAPPGREPSERGRCALRAVRKREPDGGRFCEDCGASALGGLPLVRWLVDPGRRVLRRLRLAARTAESRGLPGRPSRVPPSSRSPSRLEGEHKPVTVLFCDIVGLDRAHRAPRPRGHATAPRPVLRARPVAEVERYGGTINKFLGDGFMALVGVPTAHEDHARRAVLAALAIQERLREGRGRADDSELRVRIGLNTGRTLVGSLGAARSLDYTVVGDTGQRRRPPSAAGPAGDDRGQRGDGAPRGRVRAARAAGPRRGRGGPSR